MAKYFTEQVWQNELNLKKKILHNGKKGKKAEKYLNIYIKDEESAVYLVQMKNKFKMIV